MTFGRVISAFMAELHCGCNHVGPPGCPGVVISAFMAELHCGVKDPQTVIDDWA